MSTSYSADIDMPGMKGTDLAQQATERWPHISRVLLSFRRTSRKATALSLRWLALT